MSEQEIKTPKPATLTYILEVSPKCNRLQVEQEMAISLRKLNDCKAVDAYRFGELLGTTCKGKGITDETLTADFTVILETDKIAELHGSKL